MLPSRNVVLATHWRQIVHSLTCIAVPSYLQDTLQSKQHIFNFSSFRTTVFLSIHSHYRHYRHPNWIYAYAQHQEYGNDNQHQMSHIHRYENCNHLTFTADIVLWYFSEWFAIVLVCLPFHFHIYWSSKYFRGVECYNENKWANNVRFLICRLECNLSSRTNLVCHLYNTQVLVPWLVISVC